MIIERTALRNFRNFEAFRTDFEPGMNMIRGENAAGKTNILEAIYFSAAGSSFRRGREEDMIRFGEDFAAVDTVVNTDGIIEKIAVTLPRNGKKEITINGEQVKRIKDLDRLFDIVTFVPDDMRIIKDGKGGRRDFLDEIIATINPRYRDLVIDYNNILFQRNQLLKKNKYIRYFKEQLRAASRTLAEKGAYIALFRRDYIRKLEIIGRNIHDTLTGEELSLSYGNPLRETEYKNVVAEFMEGLKKVYPKDIKYGYTNFGIHRDDIIIKIDGKSSKSFASQGQQRTALLSLKLAQLDLLRFHKDTKPVILLDDIFSELDRNRISFIIDHIKEYQSIITTTERYSGNNANIIDLSEMERKD